MPFPSFGKTSLPLHALQFLCKNFPPLACPSLLSPLSLLSFPSTLLEKNLRKLKIQWIFVDGVEGKSNIVDISMIFSFSLHPINKYSFQNKCSPIFFNQYIPFAIFSKHLSTYILNGIFSKRILRNNQIHKNLAVSEKRTEMTLLEKISSKSWVYF